MQAQSQLTRQTITLKGRTKTVTEFFGYAVNSILFQRGIYGPETFSAVKKYGLQLQVTNDPGLTEYLGSVLKQLSEWLLEGKLQKLVLVIAKLDGGEIIERWAFDVQTDQVRGPLAPQRLACKRSPSGNA
jgi:mitotic spindle assembly checkpoint protein MAD2